MSSGTRTSETGSIRRISTRLRGKQGNTTTNPAIESGRHPMKDSHERAALWPVKDEVKKMKAIWMLCIASLAMTSLGASHRPAWAAATKCKMKYSLSGWSAGYSTASGTGTIACDNGQSGRVSLRAKGGGLTAGKSKIINGSGTFSDVADIGELFGAYASAEVHAGMVDSSAAQVVSKGTVSLAFSGTGKGVDLGLTFGEFVIVKQNAKKKQS